MLPKKFSRPTPLFFTIFSTVVLEVRIYGNLRITLLALLITDGGEVEGWNGDFRLKRELRLMVGLQPFLDRIEQFYKTRRETIFPSDRDLERLIQWEDHQLIEAENRSRRSAVDYEASTDNSRNVDFSQVASKYKLYLVSHRCFRSLLVI